MAEPAEGPWRYGPEFHQTVDRDAHEIVAKGQAIGLAWTEENARMMAASREILEVLEWASRILCTDGGCPVVEHKQMWAVIAKARGED